MEKQDSLATPTHWWVIQFCILNLNDLNFTVDASYMSFDTNYKPKGSGFSLETFIESWQSVIKT